MPRRKKARRSQAPRSATGSRNRPRTPLQYLRHAREYPIVECWINEDWADPHALIQIIIAREQPDGDLAFGVYLIDTGCLGLKQTLCNVGVSRQKYTNEIVKPIAENQPLEHCSPELAHQIIYQAIDYAAQFGFRPDKDFRDSRRILELRGRFEETAELEFGLDGRPFYFAGPYDRGDVILRKLDRAVGRGNYDFVLPADLFDDSD